MPEAAADGGLHSDTGTAGAGAGGSGQSDATGSGGSGGTAMTDAGPDGSGGVAGAGGSPVTDPYCGDGVRNQASEECDDGNAAEDDTCSFQCSAKDRFVQLNDSPARWFGSGGHRIAAGQTALAVAHFSGPTAGASVTLTLLGPAGETGAAFSIDATAASGVAEPVVAALDDGSFAVAYADFGSGPDVRLRRLAQGVLQPEVAAHPAKSGPQHSPDILWASGELIVAYVDGLDISYRRFSGDLTPLDGPASLASTVEIESAVSLAAFESTWAAAWRENAAGVDRIKARVGSVEWQTTPMLPGTEGERPTLVELDSEHLLVVFTEGTDPGMTGVASTSRLRGAVLDMTSPGVVDLFELDSLSAPYAGDPAVAQSSPALTRVDGRVFLTWNSAAPPGAMWAEECWLQELEWDGTLLTQFAELPLPIDSTLRAGRQARPVIGAGPAGTLIAAWEDRSTLLPSRSTPDLLLNVRPLEALEALVAQHQGSPGD